jgi:hypothetical protein
MGTFSDLLLGQGSGGGLLKTQTEPDAPEIAEPLAQEPKPEQPAMPSFSDQLLGGSPSKPVGTPTQETDNRSLFRKGYDLVTGRQDPAYAGIKSFDEEMQAEKNTPVIRQLRASTLVAGDDARYGDVMKDALGERFLRKERDKYGNDVIVYRPNTVAGQVGEEKKAYVNRPGLDTEDVSRAMVGSLPYIATSTPVAKGLQGAHWVIKALGQLLAGAGTSAATDVASMGFGSEQGIDPGKAAVVGGLGFAGEAAAYPIGILWRRFVTVPGLFDKSTGVLTDKGQTAAQKLGLDPDALTGKIAEEFAKAYARTREGAKLAASMRTREFDLPMTRGQFSKDPQQLMEEKAMRYGLYGDQAKYVMQDFDRRQAANVESAALTGRDLDLNPTGIGGKLAPNRDPYRDLNPSTLGQGVREGIGSVREAAKQAEKTAWENVTDLTAKPEAMDLLPDAMIGALGSMRPDKQITPAAWRMAEMLDGYMAGKPLQEDLKVLGSSNTPPTIDAMRRRLLSTSRAAGNDTDRAIAGHIYEGFNDWVGKAADQALLTGHPEAAAQLRAARSISREVKQLFSPTDARGQTTQGGRILQNVIEKADTPEGVISALFFNQPAPSGIKSGSVEALGYIKKILDVVPDKALASNTWNDLRAAYWLRLVRDRKGETFTPGVMLNNIRTAINNQRSVIETLYGPGEQKEIARFARALAEITYKDPNPSGSAVGIASLARQFFETLFKSRLARTLVEYSGLPGAYGKAAAKTAIDSTLATTKSPPLGIAGTIAGEEASR